MIIDSDYEDSRDSVSGVLYVCMVECGVSYVKHCGVTSQLVGDNKEDSI